ncbi:FGGY family carbohydrate kinase [Micromonospora sp. DT47]|uniref:FGGY family carbohydrate kinase n=1 Tax=Micromonospora sp. DT47 TaxID=3393431 RepID=UPI003CF7FC37
MRSPEPVVIGLDVGTTLTKAVAFGPDGTQLARAARATVLNRVRDGWYEQDAEQVVDSVHGVLAELRTTLNRPVAAVGLTAQGDGLWLVDADGRSVRPAISWMDGRAGPIVEEWSDKGLLEYAYRRSGSLMFPGASGPLLACLDRHDPDALDRATTAAYCKDMVLQRLTGVRATDPSDASMPFLDPRTRRYDAELLAACGLAHRRRLLAPVLAAPTGTLLPASAAVTGLPAGIPVVAGPYDLPASAWGAGVTTPGDGLLILGTTLACQVLTDRLVHDGEPCGFVLNTWQPDRWLRALPAMVGTAALDWVLRLVGAGLDDLPDLLAEGRSDGLTVLPYLAESGERAPFVAPRARGRIDGLHLGTRPADLVRAVCEAVAYSARHCLAAAGLSGALTACGGGLASPTWAQILADVLDRPVRVLAGHEIGARGAALAAAGAVGAPLASEPLPGRIYRPRPEAAHRYAEGYERYLDHVAQARAGWRRD